MDFNKLKTFIEVVESQGISGAARALRKTQSAVTQQIQSLEKSLRLGLFERRKGKLFLTREGEELYLQAKMHLQAIEDQVSLIRKDRQAIRGEIRIGLLPEFLMNWLAGVFRDFHDLYPATRFSLKLGGDGFIEKKLLDNELDFGFVSSLQEANLFAKEEVFTKKLIPVSSPSYLEKFPVSSIEDLLQADLIEFGDNFLSFSGFLKRNSRQDLLKKMILKHPVFQAADDLVIREMLLCGLGVGILPDYLVKKDFKEGKLVPVLSGVCDPFEVRIFFVSRKNSSPGLLFSHFAQAIRNKAGQAPG